MKRIKKFIDYIRESHGWKFIGSNDFFSINRITNDLAEDDKVDKEDFVKLIKDISIKYDLKFKEFSGGNSFQLTKSLLDIGVSRASDQYYLVSMGPIFSNGLIDLKYFKADQLDGLENLLTLIINYPVYKDNFYPLEFGIRYYVMIDDKPSYFTINKNGEMTGNNNVKQRIVRDMEDKGLINIDTRQVITSSVAEYLRGYK
jgi:hypothetical protein